MGLRDRISGGRKPELTVSAEPLEPAPGDEVKVRFDVAGELDSRDRAVVAFLTGYGRFEEYEQQWINGEMERKKVDRAIELHSEEREFPAAAGPGEAVFVLPESAPPSSMDVVRWNAGVKVDRAKASDEQETVPLSVRLSAERMPTERIRQESEDGLVLDDVPSAVRSGDTLTGNLEVDVSDDVSASKVLVRMRCESSLEIPGQKGVLGAVRGGSAGKSATLIEVEVSGKRKFAAGSKERIPFAIEVPAGVGPSTKHEHGHVRWLLEGVLDRRMRGDLKVEAPLVVC